MTMYCDPLTTCVWKNAVSSVATTKLIANTITCVRLRRGSFWKSFIGRGSGIRRVG